jgi:DNA-binding NtrC family response regulator
MKKLLFFVDVGGFDDFTPIFQELGYSVDFETNPRKAVKLAKKNQYSAVVAEFSYNPEFRDRVSNIESIIATLQHTSPDAKIIVLYDSINTDKLVQFQKRYTIDVVLPFPIDSTRIRQLL